MATFRQHQRVLVTLTDGSEEQGAVIYQRMGAPTYSDAVAVSVWLESRSLTPHYNGTIFDASQVRPYEPDATLRRGETVP